MMKFILILCMILNNVKADCHNQEHLNIFPKYENDRCPSGTTYKYFQHLSAWCCTGCLICAAGFRKGPNCEGLCLPCEMGKYSAEKDNWECFKCRDCFALHREVDSDCAPAKDGRCGKCLPDFKEHPDLKESPITTISCLEPIFIYYNITHVEYINNTVVKVYHEVNYFYLHVLLVVVSSLFMVVVYYFLFKYLLARRRRRQHDFELVPVVV